MRRVDVPQALVPAYSSDNPPRLASATPYASAFALPLDGRAGNPRSAEEWARAVFEGAPPLLRSGILFGWRFFLGLRLQPLEAADRVLGWRVEGDAAEAGPDSVILAADSPLLQAQNIVAVDGTVVLWVTVVRFEGRAGRLLWGVASLLHHVTIPYLLARAARVGTEDPAAASTSPGTRAARTRTAPIGTSSNGHDAAAQP